MRTGKLKHVICREHFLNLCLVGLGNEKKKITKKLIIKFSSFFYDELQINIVIKYFNDASSASKVYEKH